MKLFFGHAKLMWTTHTHILYIHIYMHLLGFFPWTMKYNKISWKMPLPMVELSLEVVTKLWELAMQILHIFEGVKSTLCDWQSKIHLFCVLSHHFTSEFSAELVRIAGEMIRIIKKTLIWMESGRGKMNYWTCSTWYDKALCLRITKSCSHSSSLLTHV